MYEAIVVEVEVADEQLILFLWDVGTQFLPELFDADATVFILVEAFEGQV